MRARGFVAAVGWIVPFIAFGIVRTRVVLAEPVAPAAQPTAAADASPAPPWSVLAGLGFADRGGFGGVGALGLPFDAFVTGERRLAGPLWLMARFTGMVSHSAADGAAGTSESTSANTRAGLGLRVAIGSREELELSIFAMVNAGYAWSGSGDFTGETSSVGGHLGVALDRDIVENFGIRVSAVVATADRSWFTWTQPDPVGMGGSVMSRSSGSNFRLALTPAAELRWSF